MRLDTFSTTPPTRIRGHGGTASRATPTNAAVHDYTPFTPHVLGGRGNK